MSKPLLLCALASLFFTSSLTVAGCPQIDKGEIDAQRSKTARAMGKSFSDTHSITVVALDGSNCVSDIGGVGYSSIAEGEASNIPRCQSSHPGNTCLAWEEDGELTQEAYAVLANGNSRDTGSVERKISDSCEAVLGDLYSHLRFHKALVAGLGTVPSDDEAIRGKRYPQCMVAKGYPTEQEATQAALQACSSQGLNNCQLFASDDNNFTREPVSQAPTQSNEDGYSTPQALSDGLKQVAANLSQSKENQSAALQAAKDQQQATNNQQQQDEAQQASRNQQRYTSLLMPEQLSARPSTPTQPSQSATSPSLAPRPSQSSSQPAPQSSYLYSDAVVADSSATDKLGQVPNIYVVNVTNTGQIRLYCTASAKAQTFNQSVNCAGPGDSGCQNITSWYTNSASSYVLPGRTARVVGIRYYAGQGSYKVGCSNSQ